MKPLFLVLLSLPALAAGVHVRGYERKGTGTYVAPSRRTAPDASKRNNWSAKGNVNPYTGKQGTR